MSDEMHNADVYLWIHTWFVTFVFLLRELVLSYSSYFLFLIGVICYSAMP